MSHGPAKLSARMRSLVDWLVLSGVYSESGEDAALHIRAVKPADMPAQISETVPAPAPAYAEPRPGAPAAAKEPRNFTSLTELNQFCTSWKEGGLARTASRAVLGRGEAGSSLLIVSDMPDDSEDRNGEAFSSPTNAMIVEALRQAGLDPSRAYYTYLSKWRTPARRNLNPYEAELCTELLIAEAKLVAPKAILGLGESVIKAFGVDSRSPGAKFPWKESLSIQGLDGKIALMASQKPEFLVKNPLMKKSFWFSLVQFAEIISAGSHDSSGALCVNYVE